jgi:hypothetical protein
MGVREWRKIARDRHLEIDPEGGQGPAWTVGPVERKTDKYTLR